ncbi:MAG: helix-turn-helix transcriptional regulator [Micromonosporaceae bacterium]|nr:helix-turn-helix transcriptional regulator [Micromonosporaceae bacterium]
MARQSSFDVTLPRHPSLGIHTLRLRDLYRRAPNGAPEPHARHRVPVHLLALVTAGRASFSVDFETYPCRPGGLLWVRPGQVVGFPPPGVDATLVLFEPQFVQLAERTLGSSVQRAERAIRSSGQLAERTLGAEVAIGSGAELAEHTGGFSAELAKHVGGFSAELAKHVGGFGAELAEHTGESGAELAASTTPRSRWRRPEGGRAADADPPPVPWLIAGTYWQPGGEDGEAITDAISQIEIDYQRLTNGEDIPIGVLRHQLFALLLRLSRLEPEGGPGVTAADNELFARFRAAVDERFALTRQVEDYAKLLGCSVRTLTRASLAATGRTAKQLVDDRVALEAKRLLAETDLPAAEIGARLGFSEATNFGRFFARTVGCSPLAFRAASRAAPQNLEPPSTPPEKPLVAALSKAGAARGSVPPPPDDISERGLVARLPRRRR